MSGWDTDTAPDMVDAEIGEAPEEEEDEPGDETPPEEPMPVPA